MSNGAVKTKCTLHNHCIIDAILLPFFEGRENNPENIHLPQGGAHIHMYSGITRSYEHTCTHTHEHAHACTHAHPVSTVYFHRLQTPTPGHSGLQWQMGSDTDWQ